MLYYVSVMRGIIQARDIMRVRKMNSIASSCNAGIIPEVQSFSKSNLTDH